MIPSRVSFEFMAFTAASVPLNQNFFTQAYPVILYASAEWINHRIWSFLIFRRFLWYHTPLNPFFKAPSTSFSRLSPIKAHWDGAAPAFCAHRSKKRPAGFSAPASSPGYDPVNIRRNSQHFQFFILDIRRHIRAIPIPIPFVLSSCINCRTPSSGRAEDKRLSQYKWYMTVAWGKSGFPK